MSIWGDLKGTVESIFQFGLNGSSLRTASSKLECRNATNTAYGDFVAGGITGYRPQITVTASKAIAFSDYNTRQYVTSGSAVVITVPKDATLNAPIGTELELQWDNTGSVTIAQEDAAVSIRSFGTGAVTGHVLAGRYAGVVLIKVAANEWRLHGAIGSLVFSQDVILLTYQLASGTDSGATTAATWNTLPLNTKVQDTGILCTLSSNQFALLAGTYEFFDTAVRSFGCNQVNYRVRNITDSADVSGLACMGSYGDQSIGVEIAGKISGRFTLAATKTLAIQAYFTTARATFGWGLPASAGTVECYGAIGLRRLY